MKRNYRLAGYLWAATLLIGLMANGPQAWATPSQTSSQQTVPTRTPKPQPTEPPGQPTSPPPIERPPEPTSPPPTVPPVTGTRLLRPTATPVGSTPTPTVTPAPDIAALSLTVQANPNLVWAGLPVEYTLTLVNESTDFVRDISLLDPLPTALEPGGIISGGGANWQDRTLRVEKDELAPGERLEVIFQVIVAADLPPGTAITNQVEASATGGLQTQASTVIVLPPAELPRVGGGADAAL